MIHAIATTKRTATTAIPIAPIFQVLPSSLTALSMERIKMNLCINNILSEKYFIKGSYGKQCSLTAQVYTISIGKQLLSFILTQIMGHFIPNHKKILQPLKIGTHACWVVI